MRRRTFIGFVSALIASFSVPRRMKAASGGDRLIFRWERGAWREVPWESMLPNETVLMMELPPGHLELWQLELGPNVKHSMINGMAAVSGIAGIKSLLPEPAR